MCIKAGLRALLAGGAFGAVAAAQTPLQQESTQARFASDGQSSILWLREFSSPGEDWINELTVLRDGGFLASGYLGRADGENESDWRALAVKIEASGSIVWQREHGAGGGIDAYFSTLTRDGWILKENAYGGPRYDRVTDLASAADGGYVLAGMTESFGAGKRDLLLLKVDANGIERWRRIFGESGNDAALYIEPASDQTFVVAGGTEGSNDDPQILVIKIDGEGGEIWRRTVGETGRADINHGLALLPDGRTVVTGYSKSWDARDNDVVAAVLSPAGEIERIDMIGGADDDRPITAKPDSEGKVWIVGYTKSTSAGGWDALVTCYDPKNGFRDLFATFGGPADDHGTAIQPLADGTLLVAGYSRGLSMSAADAFVMRVTPFKGQNLPRGIRKRKVG